MALFDSLRSGFSNAFRGGGSVLGVDIGSSSIKVVQLRKTGGKAVLETYGEISLGPYAGKSIGQVVSASTEQIATAIKDVFKEANITASRAAVSLPLRSSLLKVISLPSYKQDQIDHMVPIEARKHIPVPISEVTLDWWVLPKRGSSDRDDQLSPKEASIRTTDVLLVAIHKATLKRYQEIVEKAGLDAKTFEIETFSAMRSLLRKDVGAIAVLDLGSSTSKLTIVDYGIVRVSHIVNRGGQEITTAMTRSLGIDFDSAEKLKRAQGITATPDGAVTSPLSVSAPTSVVDYIFHECNRVIKEYQKGFGRVVGRVILTGGGAVLKGIMGEVDKHFEAEVTQGDPFSKTEVPAFLHDILANTGPEFSVSVGLALHELEEL